MSSKTEASAGEQSGKRRRISPAYDCAPEARAPTITDILPYEVLRNLFGKFLGPGHYRFVAGTCRAFRGAYEDAMPGEDGTKTTWKNAAASVACAELCVKEATSMKEIVLAAAQSGQIQVLEWACNRGYEPMEKIALVAARMGQVKVIEWAVKRGYNPERFLFQYAGRCGQVPVFEWAIKNGLKLDSSETVITSAAGAAAATGQVKVLEWMMEHGAQHDFFRLCAGFASNSGHVCVLEWLKRRGLAIRNADVCWNLAASCGHVPILIWLLENGYSLPPGLLQFATQPDVIQFIQDHQVG